MRHELIATIDLDFLCSVLNIFPLVEGCSWKCPCLCLRGWKPNQRFVGFFEVFIWYSGVGWGGVGWGGVITYIVRCCEFSCTCITLTYMLRCCKFSCASLHTSCYAAARSLALPYIPTCYAAASSLALPYIPTCYAAASSLALPYILHATLRPCTSIHTVMLRCCKFSCASLHTSCYAATLHFHTYRHATLLQVLLHFPTYFMLRCDLALPYIPSCYAAASSLALPYIRHATLLQVLLHFPAYVHATLLHFLCFPREFMLSHVWGGVVPYSNWFIFLVIYTYIYKSLGLTFARNPRNSIRDCHLLCCFLACFFAHCEHAKYWYYLRLMAFLRLVPKSPFEGISKISSVICSVSSR